MHMIQVMYIWCKQINKNKNKYYWSLKVWYIILDVKRTNMNMGLVNSLIAHWMQQLAGNCI